MADSFERYSKARLLLTLYDLRREEKLRKARQWFMENFVVEKMEDMETGAQ